MKFSKIIIILLIAFGFFIVSDQVANAALPPYRSHCVAISGKYTMKNWKGGPIMIGCSGDNGGNLPKSDQCDGQIKTIYPNQSFRLTRCSCFGSSKGCLIVGKTLVKHPLVNGKRLVTISQKIQTMSAFTSNSCTINKTNVCGSNGKHYTKNITIKCKKAPTPTPTPVPSGEPSITPVPTQCVAPSAVTNVKVSCPNCFDASDTGN